MKPAVSFLLLNAALLAASCTSDSSQTPSATKAQQPILVPIEGFYSELKTCRARYAEIDAKIDAAGVRDTAFYRVPGFPYLRTDRLLASYRDQVQDVNEVGGWIRRMREFDQEAREFELENLGLTRQEVAIWRFEFLNCGRGLSGLEFDEPKNLELVRATAVPPDDYTDSRLYPLTLPLLRLGIAREESRVKRSFAQPVKALLGEAAPLRWQVETGEDLTLIPKSVYDSYPDELGIPGLVDSAWRAIAEANAPDLMTVNASNARALGAPAWTEAGIDVDTKRPWVNYQIGFTRFGGRSLVQVDYFFWFKLPDQQKQSDGAPIDGLIWRVTLDEQLKPMAYESVRASGRDHFWFALENSAPRKPDGGDAKADAQAPFFPQATPAPAAAALVLETASGGVRQVVAKTAAEAAAPGETRRYQLHRYEDLYLLPLPGTGPGARTRSLFDTNGRIAGTRTPAPGAWLANAIPDPGALRHLSHLPLDYVGRRHFDDPYILESVFVAPPPPTIPPVKNAG